MIPRHFYAPLQQNTFFTVKGFKMGAPSPELIWPQPEADHSLPSSAKVKNARSYTSTPPHVFMLWCYNEHRDNFTFYISDEIQITISVL
jgi:hypothetical protein